MTEIVNIEAFDIAVGTDSQQANQQDKVNFEKELSSHDVLVFTDEGIKPQAVEGGETVVDAITDKVDEAHRNYQENLRSLQDDLLNIGNDGFSAGDVVKLQFRIAQLHIQSSVTTSIANKAHDGLKTLFRQS